METLLLHVALAGFNSMRSACIRLSICLKYDLHMLLLQIFQPRANNVDYIILELALLLRWFLAAAFDLIVLHIFCALSIKIAICNFYLCA